MTERWGIWSDRVKDWHAINDLVFSTPNRNVALAQIKYIEETQGRILESGTKNTMQLYIAASDWRMRARSFDEWAREREMSAAVDKWDKEN